jgi:hypothetical protein
MKNTLTLSFVLAVAALGGSSMAQNKPMNMSQGSMKMEQSMGMKMMGESMAFKGIEVNGGTVHLHREGKKTMLMVSSDFKIPNSPAPHWQIVDAQGNVYLLNQFKIAGDKLNREITLPSYIKSVKSVQVWCSFAEVVLGQADFAKPIKLG